VAKTEIFFFRGGGMPKYFVRYGCYIGMDAEVIEAASLQEAQDYAYNWAYERTDSWVGMHGFITYDEEDWDSEEEYWEAVPGMVEEACDYSAEEYDPEKHDMYL
jgi:hypothetical protein